MRLTPKQKVKKFPRIRWLCKRYLPEYKREIWITYVAWLDFYNWPVIIRKCDTTSEAIMILGHPGLWLSIQTFIDVRTMRLMKWQERRVKSVGSLWNELSWFVDCLLGSVLSDEKPRVRDDFQYSFSDRRQKKWLLFYISIEKLVSEKISLNSRNT